MEPQIEPAIWRMLDSNLNRASEALRVIEDCCRFGLTNSRLSEATKILRHRLSSHFKYANEANPDFRQNMLKMRNSINDVGRNISIESENFRSGIVDLLTANFSRLHQALRTLEETSKVVDVQLAAGIEQLRYDAYDLEKQTAISDFHAEQLKNAWLYVLIDGDETIDEFASKVRNLIDAGVPLLQLRDKRLSDRELMERGNLLHELTNRSETNWIFNDRVDLALACKADGVHLGQDDISVSIARQIAGPNLLIGVSTHSLAQFDQAIADGADYVGVGPVFNSDTKSFEEFVGLHLLQAVSQRSSVPAFAIGGINLENASEVFSSGFKRIAVSGVFADSACATATMKLLDAIRANPVE